MPAFKYIPMKQSQQGGDMLLVFMDSWMYVFNFFPINLLYILMIGVSEV